MVRDLPTKPLSKSSPNRSSNAPTSTAKISRYSIRRRALETQKLDERYKVGQDCCPINESATKERTGKEKMDSKTNREHRDAILGSPPLSSAHEAQPNSTFTPLQFDAREFLQYVEDAQLTEAEATALLSVTWEIVVAFVDMGFGLSPVQQALVDRSLNSPKSASPRGRAELSSKDSFSKIAKQNPAGRGHTDGQ